MNGDRLRQVLDRVMASLQDGKEEFRRLDAAIGDGDLGVTIDQGAMAVRESLTALEEGSSVADTVSAAARAFTTANPSTFSALVGGGSLRAAATLGNDPVDLADAVRFSRALYDTVAAKGKAARGDKTLLDALGPAVEALEAAVGGGISAAQAIDATVDAAREGVDRSTPMVSVQGRARWIGERTRGNADPGAVVVLRFLEAWRDAHETG